MLLLPYQGQSQFAFLVLWGLQPRSSRENTVGQMGSALGTTPAAQVPSQAKPGQRTSQP